MDTILGAPVPGATLATVSLAHVVAAIEFVDMEIVEPPGDASVLIGPELELEPPQVGSLANEVDRPGNAR